MIFVLLAVFVVSFGQSNISTVINGWGYPLEVHEVETEDGFILQLLRVPHGKNTPATKGPVLLQHGLQSCAGDWWLNDPTESLGFLLADRGYDVWVGNNRGNGYSMKHKVYNTSQPEFWYWTWDVFGKIDLPTEINYVLSVTGKQKLSYMGISQGTTQAFAGLSENPALAEKLNLFVAFAPVAYVFSQRSLLFYILAELDLDELIDTAGNMEFYLPVSLHKILPDFCKFFPSSCENALFSIMGPSIHLNESRIPFYAEYEIAPTSVWNIGHWAQAVRANVFQHMDWGTEGNMKHYNQPTPPLYDLSKFPSATLPTALFTGGNDYLADPNDVQHLLDSLPAPPVLVVNQPTYAHADYVLAATAAKYIYPQVFDLLEKYAH